ncbi:hypothetical protein F4779DRAFT_577765 [Xylariaceae sp. FL0662B]|nr:hypothetical protein F4779DRAFT_577765 [Xylariaceae sp. FL0662B]
MQPESYSRDSVPPVSRSQSQPRSHPPIHMGGPINFRNIDPWLRYESRSPSLGTTRRGSLVSSSLQSQVELSRPHIKYPPVAARGFLPQRGTTNYPSHQTGLGRPMRRLYHHNSNPSNPPTTSIPALYCSPDRPYSAPAYPNPLSNEDYDPSIVLQPRPATSQEEKTAHVEMPPPRPPVFPERRATLQDNRVSRTTPSSTQNKAEPTKPVSVTRRAVARRGLAKTLTSLNNPGGGNDQSEDNSGTATDNSKPTIPMRSQKRANEYMTAEPKPQKRPFFNVIWDSGKDNKYFPCPETPSTTVEPSRQEPEANHDSNGRSNNADKQGEKNNIGQDDSETVAGDPECASELEKTTSKTNKSPLVLVANISKQRDDTETNDQSMDARLQQWDIDSQHHQEDISDLSQKQGDVPIKPRFHTTETAPSGTRENIGEDHVEDTMLLASICSSRDAEALAETQNFNFSSRDHKEDTQNPTMRNPNASAEVQNNNPRQSIDVGSRTTLEETNTEHRRQSTSDVKTLSSLFKEAEMMLDEGVTHGSSLEEIYAILTNVKALIHTNL